jgi:hypothetical protein
MSEEYIAWLEEGRHPPCAEIIHDSKRTFLIQITDGVMDYGPNGGYWIVWRPTTEWARAVAERKAKKELKAYLLKKRSWVEPERVFDA